MHSDLFTLLDSQAKHVQSFKKRVGRLTENFCAIYIPSGFAISFRKFMSMALYDVIEGEISCMATTSPRRA